MKVTQAVGSVRVGAVCSPQRPGTGSDRLPALSAVISSACLKRFPFSSCGCWWFQHPLAVECARSPPSWEPAGLGQPAEPPQLPRTEPSPPTLALLKLPHCSNFKPALSGSQALPSAPALLCSRAALLVVSVPWSKAHKADNLAFFPATL